MIFCSRLYIHIYFIFKEGYIADVSVALYIINKTKT